MYPREVWVILGLMGLLGIAVTLLRCTGTSVRDGSGVLLLCMVAGAAFSFLRVAHTTHVSAPSSIESYASEGCREHKCPELVLRGFISDEPDRRPMQTRYTVEVSSLDTPSPFRGKGWATRDDTLISVTGRVLVTDFAPWPRHAYGDEVRVRGVLERPGQIVDSTLRSNSGSPTGSPQAEFAYDRYLSRYDIYSVMPRASVETISRGHGYPLLAFLYAIKSRFEAALNRLLPEPHASFMAGLLTGSRRGIPQHLLRDFQATGLTHIIAISGYNISIVIAVITSCLFFLPLRWRFLPSLLAIGAFTLFVGASPSVVRAAIMGGIGLLALQTGRQKHALIAILLTAVLMTAWNPKVLWYDLGFQLSFLSVLGLSLLAPLLAPLCARVPSILGFRESLQMTLAAQLAAVPLIVLAFGQFSLVAPLANLLVAPLIPLAMLFGFLGTIVSFVFPFAGLLLAYPGWGALELIIRITAFLAAFPHAVLRVSISMGLVILYYAGLLLLLSFMRAQRSFSPAMRTRRSAVPCSSPA